MILEKNKRQKTDDKTDNEVNNLTGFSVDIDLLKKVVDGVMEEELPEKERKNKKISIAVVEAKKIREMSRIYRGKDYATDVLSFFYNEKFFLGEIVLCPEKIKENSGVSFTKEICRVTIHGVLHLLGYGHEKDEKENKMKEKEKYYLKKILK